jgi:hypothetical protein
VDQALHTAEIISRERAHDLTGLVTKFDAAWWIIEHDSLLDDGAALADAVPTLAAPPGASPVA